MRKIRIISGGYGLRTGTRVTLKDKYSAPFDVDDNEAERLVSLGVAECVDTRIATPVIGDEKEKAGENTPETEEDAEGVSEGAEDTPVYSTESSVAYLRKIAKENGIIFKVGMTKEDMVKALDDFFKCEEDTPPMLEAGEPIL